MLQLFQLMVLKLEVLCIFITIKNLDVLKYILLSVLSYEH